MAVPAYWREGKLYMLKPHYKSQGGANIQQGGANAPPRPPPPLNAALHCTEKEKGGGRESERREGKRERESTILISPSERVRLSKTQVA